MTERTIGWGVLGAGSIARAFTADILGAGLTVAAVGARDADRAAAYAAEFGIEGVHGSYEALVSDPSVDVVYIATPQPFHAEQAQLAIAAGKAVLVEKSFTADAAGAQRVVDAARAAGVFAMEAMWTRFVPVWAHIREELDRGAIGEVHEVVSHHFQKLRSDPTGRHYDPALGGGAMADLGVYGVSLASWLFGPSEELTVVGATTEQRVDTWATVLGRHSGGARSATHTAMDRPGPNSASIIGTEGYIDVDPYWFSSTSATRYDAGRPGRVVARFEAPAHHGRGMHFQALEVERCLREGLLESPVMPLDETVAIMRTLDEVRGRLGAV